MSLHPNETVFNKIDDFISNNADKIIKDTIDLINIPSVSTDKSKINEAMSLILQKGKEYGFNSYEVLDGQVGLIEFGQGDETVGMLAHIDVVDAEGTWKFGPFNGVVFENQIWGRGAVDDKGPLVTCLHAMRSIKELNLPIYKKIQLIIGTQEEVEWTDMKEYVKNYKLPDYGFTPDGEFPIENREKGYVDVIVTFKQSEAGSEGLYKIVSIEGGKSVNSIPSRAEAFISGDLNLLEEKVKQYITDNPDEKISFSVTQDGLGAVAAEGLSAHSAYPEKGINALATLCRFLESLSLVPNGADRLVKFIVDNFYNDFNGKKLGLYNESEYFKGEYVSRTVISPTLLKTEDGKFELNLNLRTAYGTEKEDLDRAFSDAAKDYNYSYIYRDYMGPIFISKERPFVKAMADSYEEVSGLKNEFILAHGTSYAKAMPNILCFGPIFPGEEDFCHEKDERINIDSLIKSTKIYAHTLARIVLNTASFK
ncbi:MAG TPA: M20 family metallopeptidase [Thermoanaerobacterales bacterium]|nr:M20 family metallopeptidase [Thermoanaerobacterales bacterium]